MEDWLEKVEEYLNLMERFEKTGILDPEEIVEIGYEFEKKHGNYLRAQKDYIDGKTDEFNKTFDPTKCTLGRWMASYKPTSIRVAEIIEELKESHALKEDIKDLSRAFEEVVRDSVVTRAGVIRKSVDRSVRLIIAGILIGLGVSVFIGVWTSRSITKRISEILEKIAVFASGDLTVKFDTRGRDEILEMGKTLSGMVEEAVERTEGTADVVDEVARQAESIGEILQTIESIADQTNLLALNAAIEAARAGEMGKGFAVVADEIRKLAEESREATERIATILNDMKEKSERAQEAMKGVVEAVERTRERSENAMEMFEKIVKKVRNVLDMTESLVATAQEQGTAAEEMASAMDGASRSVLEITESINRMTDRMRELSEQSKELSEMGSSLREMAQALKEFVDKFRV